MLHPHYTFTPESRFNRPTTAQIDIDALLHNLAETRRLSPHSRILAVVKANGYGHGAVLLAKELEAAGVDFFGVSLVEEGVDLRQAGIRGDIMVLGSACSNYADIVSHDLVPVVFTSEHLSYLQAAAERANRSVRAHLKIDTGMGRLGLTLENLPLFLQSMKTASRVIIEGLLSHFAKADEIDGSFNRLQLERYEKALSMLQAAGHTIKIRHMANSAATLNLSQKLEDMEFNLIRPGLILYGEYPAAWLRSAAKLKPVMNWKTSIIHIKRVAAGMPISYGGTWVSNRESIIATLPVGYADGYNRKLSNRGHVLVRGKRAPVVGNICMDMCMVDVTDIPQASLHDEVVLLGRQGLEIVSAQELAELCDTIPYEILCAVSVRVPRVLVWRNV